MLLTDSAFWIGVAAGAGVVLAVGFAIVAWAAWSLLGRSHW